MPIIYIDADACPVKDETVDVAARLGVRVIIVSNGGLRPSREPHVDMVYVADGPDVADNWIAERIGAGDICITADIPLADRCLKAGAEVLKPSGEALTKSNIGSVLATRNLMADLREQGTVTSRHAAFSKADRARFKQALDRAVRRSLA